MTELQRAANSWGDVADDRIRGNGLNAIRQGAVTSVAWGDYNNDGWLDIYLGKYYYANQLYHNIGGHTFYLIGGVWIDGKFRAAMKDRVREVEAFSDEYFALLSSHPGLSKILAFSARILVVLDDKVIEIV